MKAYDRGFDDGTSGRRRDRARTYETNKAENAYWDGYTAGMIHANPGKMIVQCQREGRMLAVDPGTTVVDCDTCGRRYIKEGDTFESDRTLKIVHVPA